MQNREAMVFLTAALVVVGALSFGAALLQWDAIRGQLDEMKTDHRAWLAPSRVEWIEGRAPQAGRDVSVALAYGNVGKEPALDYGGQYRFGLFEPDPTLSYINMRFGQNKACDGLDKNPGGATVYPGSAGEYRTELVIPAGYINENLVTGAPVVPSPLLLPVIYVHGCLAYHTLGKTAHSGYCFYLHPDANAPLTRWMFRACSDGNKAD
jgi:hypothetical protein